MYTSDKVSIPRRAAAVVLLRLAAGSAALGDALLQPGELRIDAADGDGVEALVERIVAAGAEVRAELRLADGATVWGRLDRERAEQLELREGQILAVRLGSRNALRHELPRAA